MILTPPTSQLILYQTEDGQTRLEVRLEDESVWLSQKLMADLFQKDVRTINEHVKNVFDEKGLSSGLTTRKFRIVQTEGSRQVNRNVEFYLVET